MATVQDWVTEALEELGLIGAGDTPSSADSDFAFRRFNRFIDRCKAERMAYPLPLVRTTWTITQTASFTVGSGGTVNVARPVYVDHVSYQDPALSTPEEIPLTPLTDDAYAAWPMKTQTSTLPTAFYYSPTFASSLATLYLLPIATTSLTGVLYAPSPVAEYAALTTSVVLPPGYHEFFVTNLAVALASGFKVPVDPELRERARESKATVKRSNTRLMDMSIEAAALGGSGQWWSIMTGP